MALGLTPVVDDALVELTVGERDYIPIESRDPGEPAAGAFIQHWTNVLTSTVLTRALSLDTLIAFELDFASTSRVRFGADGTA